jgi:hypothetical protein
MSWSSVFSLFARPLTGIHNELRRLNENLEMAMEVQLHLPTRAEYKQFKLDLQQEEREAAGKAADRGGILRGYFAAPDADEQPNELQAAIAQVRDMEKKGEHVSDEHLLAIARAIEEEEAVANLPPGAVPHEW